MIKKKTKERPNRRMWRNLFYLEKTEDEEDEGEERGKEHYRETQQPSVIINANEKLSILNMSPVGQTEGVTSCIHIYLSSQ